MSFNDEKVVYSCQPKHRIAGCLEPVRINTTQARESNTSWGHYQQARVTFVAKLAYDDDFGLHEIVIFPVGSFGVHAITTP